MAQSYTFRKSIKGFNRDDVVAYIAHIQSQYESTIHQLQADNAALSSQLEEAKAQLEEISAQLEVLQAQPVVEEAPAEEAPKPENWIEAELNAYRRAESAERRARERVTALYDTANGLTADAIVRIQESAQSLEELTNAADVALTNLQQALFGSKDVLQSVVSGLESATLGDQ